MEYVGRIFRPHGEARSLLLQVTLDVRDHSRSARGDGAQVIAEKPLPALDLELRDAARLGPAFTRAFVCDGDALSLSARRLERILTAIRMHLPWISKVGMFGDSRGVRSKSVDELRRLRHLGLDIIYHAVETGDDALRGRIDHAESNADCVQTAEKLRACDIVHSVSVMLGLGGKERSTVHARETARLLSEMDPPRLATLTTTIFPNTPLAEARARGEFALPGQFELLEELYTIIDESELTKCLFSAQHPSNHLPLEASLPEDRTALLRILADFIDTRDMSTLRTVPSWAVQDGFFSS